MGCLPLSLCDTELRRRPADLDYAIRSEPGVLAFPFIRIASLVCEDPCCPDMVVMRAVIVTMDPELGLPSVNQFAQVGDEGRRERAALMSRLDRPRVWSVMAYDDGWPVVRLCELTVEKSTINAVLGRSMPGHEAAEMTGVLPIANEAVIVEFMAGNYHRMLWPAVEPVVGPQDAAEEAHAVDHHGAAM